MALDKWIAAFFLVGSIVYGYAAFTYRLLPFERNMAFLPNTLPIVLSILAGVLAFLILVSPNQIEKPSSDNLENTNDTQPKDYKTGQAAMLIGLMILYAVALRPAGFLIATTVFLVGTGWSLGERKLHVMIPIALAGAGTVWLLVQQALGIFLKPLPWFMG